MFRALSDEILQPRSLDMPKAQEDFDVIGAKHLFASQRTLLWGIHDRKHIQDINNRKHMTPLTQSVYNNGFAIDCTFSVEHTYEDCVMECTQNCLFKICR